jgi:AraC-like DNA-binding protein
MREQILYHSELVEIGRFVINSEDADFSDCGFVSASIIVFRKYSIWIQHEGAQPFVADTGVVNLYNAGQVHQRFAIHPARDHCHWFRLSDELLQEVLGDCHQPFEQPSRLCAPELFLAHLNTLQQLALNDQPDPLVIGTAVVELYTALFSEGGTRWPYGVGPMVSHLRLMQAVKKSLQQDLGVNLSLQLLAKRHATSPHHLCRVFKHTNNVGINRYRSQQRLRSLLLKLRDPMVPLTALALDHGFASHAHMSAQLKKHFGMIPSVCRQQLYGH